MIATGAASAVRATMALCLAAGALAAGCGEDDGGATLDGLLCDGMAQDAAAALTAGPLPDDSAPAPALDSGRVDVTLVTFEGGLGGFVKIEGANERDTVVGLSADVALAIVPVADGAAEAPAPARAAVGCEGVAVRHTVRLPFGQHLLRFGPTDEAVVGVLVHRILRIGS